MAELKPCPFCGETTYIEALPLWRTYADGTTHGYFGAVEYVIKCHNMECRCSVFLGRNDTIYNTDLVAKANAIEAWNRRAEDENKI